MLKTEAVVVVGVGIVVAVVAVMVMSKGQSHIAPTEQSRTPPASAETVTQRQAEAAVARAMEIIKDSNKIISRGARATVSGVTQASNTMATADLVFEDAVADCGTWMGPGNAGAPWLMKRWGRGQAEFKLYTGRGWMLTSIRTDEMMCSGSFELNNLQVH